VDGQLREMQSSMLLMDLIFRLKLRFPRQVFYVRGNHDSFSEDIAKDGIPQGLLWAKELGDQRGSRLPARHGGVLPPAAVRRFFRRLRRLSRGRAEG
jgi:hypothetical protein